MTQPLTNALAMRTAAAEACDAQYAVFASTEYAIGQPLSSFSERFACSEVKEAILALPLEADHADLLREAVMLPEVARLINQAKYAEAVLQNLGMYRQELEDALQPLLALETP